MKRTCILHSNFRVKFQYGNPLVDLRHRTERLDTILFVLNLDSRYFTRAYNLVVTFTVPTAAYYAISCIC
jgi:hypothetical protein